MSATQTPTAGNTALIVEENARQELREVNTELALMATRRKELLAKKVRLMEHVDVADLYAARGGIDATDGGDA